MSKNDPAERAVHGLGRHPHGLSERLQVVERGVGQAEGVHQHAGVTADGRAAAIAWTPPGFRAFDTGTVDDSASADDEGTTAPEPQPTVADTPLGDAPEDAGDNADGGADPSGADSDTSQSGDPEAGAPADNVADPAQAEAPRRHCHVNSVASARPVL